MKYLICALLVASPLAAQQTVTIPPPDIIVNLPPLEITNEIRVMSDSAMIANLNRNLEALREQIAERECNTCGGANTTTKVAVAVLIPVLIWIAWELRGIKNNSEGTPGAPGKDGVDGADGQDGKDGEDGEDHDDDHHQYGESG